jgi:hypothetical protein
MTTSKRPTIIDALAAECGPVDVTMYSSPWPWPFTVADVIQVWATSATVNEFATRLEIPVFTAIGVATLVARSSFDIGQRPGGGISVADTSPPWSEPVKVATDAVGGFVIESAREQEAEVSRLARTSSKRKVESRESSAKQLSRVELTQRLRAWLRFVSAWSATDDFAALGEHYGFDPMFHYPIRSTLSRFVRRLRAEGVMLPRRDWEIGSLLLPSEARLVEEFRRKEAERAAIRPPISHRAAM